MGRSKKDIEEMPDDIYLGVTYGIPISIVNRFLKALKNGWESFMIPAEWLGNISFAQLHAIGLDCWAKPARVFFGKEYYQLYKHKRKKND